MVNVYGLAIVVCFFEVVEATDSVAGVRSLLEQLFD